jgi:hypothetical protein
VTAKQLRIRLIEQGYWKMGTDRLGRPHRSWLACFLVCACFCFLLLPPTQAAQAKASRDTQGREAVRHAIELAQPGVNVDELELSGRDDLNDQLSHIAPKTTGLVSFYSLYDADSSDEGSLWVAVPGASPLDSGELYSFETSDNLGESSEKFNRLISHLALSVPNEKAASIGRLFLDCCVRDTHGEIVSDEDVLRHSVERYYIRIYGDVWRALEAYTQWWQAYQKLAVDLRTKVVADAGLRRITLERLVLGFGMHPQLEQWEIAVSPEGSVRVLDVNSVFPKHTRWLSYAFRSTIDPRIH